MDILRSLDGARLPRRYTTPLWNDPQMRGGRGALTAAQIHLKQHVCSTSFVITRYASTSSFEFVKDFD